MNPTLPTMTNKADRISGLVKRGNCAPMIAAAIGAAPLTMSSRRAKNAGPGGLCGFPLSHRSVP